MSYTLIGNGEQLLNNDGFYLSADMSTYNDTGTNISDYKFIDYGPEDINSEEEKMTYMIGNLDYLNPLPSPVATAPFDSHASQGNNLSSKFGFVCITFDEYRQHSRTETNATAEVNTTNTPYYRLGALTEYKFINMNWALAWKSSSGTCYQIGQGSSSGDLYGTHYTMEFISGTTTSVKYNNNMWEICSPGLRNFIGESPQYNLYDIWYDNNEIVYPTAGSWSYTATDKYNEVTNEGFLKSNAFYYRNKRLISGKLVKNSSKILIDLSNNNLYYCDKENDNYRMLISAKVPKELPLYDVKNLFGLEAHWSTENSHGGAAGCWFLTKDLQVKYLNCPLNEAIEYKPSANTINKDSVTVWDDINLDNSSTPRYIVPGDNTIYTDPNLVYTSSFSNTGYYVLKCDISGVSNEYSCPAEGMLCGNMFKNDTNDEFLNVPVTPLSLTFLGTANSNYDKFMGLADTYVTASSNKTSTFDNGYKLYSDSSRKKLGNNYFISNDLAVSANHSLKAKWIFYKSKTSPLWDDYSYTQQIDYCLYDNLISAYMPKGYIRTGDGIKNNVLTNNNVYFMFVTLKWSNTAVTNDVKYSNIEFFHTSSYYDALNG